MHLSRSPPVITWRTREINLFDSPARCPLGRGALFVRRPGVVSGVRGRMPDFWNLKFADFTVTSSGLNFRPFCHPKLILRSSEASAVCETPSIGQVIKCFTGNRALNLEKVLSASLDSLIWDCTLCHLHLSASQTLNGIR